MFWHSSEKSTHTYAGIIDIGSATIGIGIAVSEQNEEKPKLLYADRLEMRGTRNDHKERERKVNETLLSAGLLLSQKGTPIIKEHSPSARLSKLYVTCSSPWSKAYIEHIHHEENEPVKVTTSFLEELIKENESNVQSRVSGEMSPEDVFDIVERTTVSVALNGYDVIDYEQKTAKTIDLTHTFGLFPKSILTTVTSIHEKLFSSTTLESHTNILVTYCVLRDLFPRNTQACIINVTGEATEFAVIENGNICTHDSIPYGFHTVVRSIMETTKKPYDDVISLIRGSAEKTSAYTFDVAPVFLDYQKKVESCLATIHERFIIPDSAFITTQEIFEPHFIQYIRPALETLSGSSTICIPVTTTLLQDRAETEYRDAYMLMIAQFFHKITKNSKKLS